MRKVYSLIYDVFRCEYSVKVQNVTMWNAFNLIDLTWLLCGRKIRSDEKIEFHKTSCVKGQWQKRENCRKLWKEFSFAKMRIRTFY
jgi:hypothetical protein